MASLAITSILLLAVGQALRFALVASGSAPSAGTTTAAQQALAADVADQIAADLNVALNFTEKAAAAVTFTVPDRDRDGQPEQLRYAWSGAAGTPAASPPVPAYTLTREQNGGGWVALASDVRKCDFTLLYRQVAAPPAPPAEALLLSYGINSTGGTDTQVTTSAAVAQVFSPPVSPLAASWSLTRIQLQLKCTSDTTYDGTIKVQVRTADPSNVPTATVLEEVVLPEVALADAYQPIDVYFKKLTNLGPTQNLAVVVIGSAGTAPHAVTPVASPLVGIPLGTAYTTSSDGGVNWGSVLSTSTLRYAVYGKVPP